MLAILSGCQDLDRENPLDPKNPQSSRQPVFLIEAFINTSSQLEAENTFYNTWAVHALDSLHDLYGGQLIIAEYHRAVTDPKYADEFALPDRYEALYTRYVNANGTGGKGVPDIFINGAVDRIQGAHSASSVYDRMNEILSGKMSEEGLFTLEPVVTVSGGDIRVSCKIARLGNRPEQALRLRLVFVKDFSHPLLKRVVVAEDEVSKYTKSINRLTAGEYLKLEFNTIHFSTMPDAVILILSDKEETHIFHSAKVVI